MLRHYYSPEFKLHVIKEVLQNGESCAQVARKYHLSALIIGAWVRSFKKQHAEESALLRREHQ